MKVAQDMITDPVLTILPSAFFAMLWGIAAVHKALDWRLFHQQLGDYRVLPERFLPVMAALLPVLELVLAAGWLFEVARMPTALFSITLLLGYAAAIACNLRRGRDTIDCGCGGSGQSIRWALVWRNVVLALLAAPFAGGIGANDRALGWVDWITVAGGSLVILGLYGIVNQILANMPPQRLMR